MNERRTTQLPEAVRREIFQSLRGTGKRMELRTAGHSMAPLIRDGMRVTIEFVTADRIVAGDVILFERQGDLILHRAIARDPASGQWIEKGDHQPLAGRVHPDEIWGRVVPSGSRMARALITRASRLEWGLYRMKIHLLGDRPTGVGRAFTALGSAVRRLAAGTHRRP